MKKFIILSIACSMATVANAQKLPDAQVPAAVKAAFNKSFPTAKGVHWSKENADEFEAEFKADGKEVSANFTTAGVWTETETEIKNSQLPKPIQDAIAKDFSGYKIEEAEKTEGPGKGLEYEAELEKGEVTIEVVFSSDGKVLKKEEVKEKKD